ncbi:MAG: phosphate ABC transporter substrate-binding protein [Treponema sp.]|jgi:phosphate transport system substrate-binding protein|nr:phosphate ABC transporter substrate-binding protein [Treponema sp.]
MKRFSVAALLAVIAWMPVSAGGAGESRNGGAGSGGPAPYTITIAGSTSVNPLMELLIAAYKKGMSHVDFSVSATGSGDGIKAVPAETAEIGMSSRELSAAEKGTGIDQTLIAVDGIAVIVNPANPLTSLSGDQIRDIYTGRITDWSQLDPGKSGAIAVVSREPGSGTRGAFEELLKFQDQLVKGAVEFDGTGAIKAEISRNADAVGYISLGSVDGTVKALQVEGVAATPANVVSGTYKIARPFLLLTKKGKALHRETRAFLDWVLSPPGQDIVKTSWIPVK